MKKASMARMLRAAGSLALTIALATGCASDAWRSLDSMDQLEEAFNRDAGKYRIVLLLSPT